MKTCKDCRHWRKIRDEDFSTENGIMRGPHGECLKIDEFSLEHNAWITVFIAPEDLEKPMNADAEGNLMTRADFGCNLFETNWEKYFE